MATTATSATSSTNLDVNGIVAQLMTVERQPITKLNTQEASYQAKLSAFGTLSGAVSAFQSSVQGLSSASQFQTLKATPSDATVFSASTVSTAVAGSYTLDVTSLAQAQKLVATGQTSSTAAIGSGASTTVTFDFGTISGGVYTPYVPATGAGGTYAGSTFTSNGNGTKSITLDATNNSLQGIRDAINAAGIGVTASIVNDGSGTPYRLTLSSSNMGVSNSLSIAVSGDATISGLLANDPTGVQHMAQSAVAQNAVFNINGVQVSKTSNTVSDVIQGVTLNLLKAATGASLTVARDTAATTTAITGFVKAYNDLAKTLADSSSYNAATQTGAILQGDSTVRSLQAQLRNALSTSVSGTSGALTTLSQIGITFQKDGSLALDSGKLNTAMTTYPNDIASLFASVGKGTDSLVSFNTASASTKPGNYAVNITQLAMTGATTGNVIVPATGNIIASGTTINVTLDGASTAVALTAGTYTNTQLATMIQSAINGTSAFSAAGSSVAASINGSGFLNISSSRYGASSNIGMTDGTGTTVATTFMGGVTSSSGMDVAGTIGGVGATGSGQLLSVASGDPQGLSIVVNGGIVGARGTLNYSQGYGTTLSRWATSILGSSGVLTARTDGINKTIKDIGLRRDALNTRLIGVEARYRAQFTHLDAMLTSMNATSTFLTQQLAKL